MPKKYQNRALLTKPNGSAPTTLTSNSSPSCIHGEPSRPSVNELLKEARRVKGDKGQSHTIVSTASLHPAIREVLNIPSPVAPTPRTQLRGPTRVRRIPGPPPPQSWLSQSSHASNDQRVTLSKLRMIRARIQQQSSTLPGLVNLPRTESLEHLIYTKIAVAWQWHVYHDHVYMSTLPLLSRITLLSYIAVYNDPVTTNPFPYLFPAECEGDELGAVTRLDLANSIGSWATVKKIERELVFLKDCSKSNGKSKESDSEDIPESWDDDTLSDVASVIPPSMQTRLRFPNLKHLSLAFNPASSSEPPSWASLISLTSHMPGLLSLSLAHWPAPTYTPNAARGRVKIVDTGRSSGPAQVQVFGGTDVYTAFDNNWREAAGILRSLSRNLYCLTWLDLTGCVSWFPALTWRDEKFEGVHTGAEWNGSWRNISTLILAVGWLPGNPADILDGSSSGRSSTSLDSTRAIEQLYGGQEAIQKSLEAIASIRLGSGTGERLQLGEEPAWNVEEERQKQSFRRDVERFFEQQASAKLAADDIKEIRRSVSGTKRIDFDFGKTIDEQTLKNMSA